MALHHAALAAAVSLVASGCTTSAPPPADPAAVAVDRAVPLADRERAVLTLADGGPEATDKLRALLAPGEPPEVRAAAVTGLVQRRDWQSMPRFLDLLADDALVVRGRAAAAVVQLMGRDFGFDPAAPPAERARKAAAMRREFDAYGPTPPPPFRK